MPPIKKKKRVKALKNCQEQGEDTESSESGKLSETHEVAQHLSRTRLDKENSSRKAKSLDKRKGRLLGDPYDADSEPEPVAPLASMLIDQNIPLQSQPYHLNLPSIHAEHSTPNYLAGNHNISDCFGFDNMATTLPYSPVVGEPMVSSHYVLHSPGSASVASSIVSISPGKRKADPRVFDVPIEKPIKKIKKKKTNRLLDVQIEDQHWVTEMKSQFEEIEMVDLVID